MRHRISFYLTYICIVLFGALGVLLLALGEKDPRESKSENRMLAGFPTFSLESVGDGSFMSGLESYLSDGLPSRERIVVDTAVLMDKLSLERKDVDEDVQKAVEAFGSQTVEPTESAPGTEPPETPVPTPEPEITPSPSSIAEATEAPSPVPEETQQPTAAPLSLSDVPACSFRRTRANGTSPVVETYSARNMRNAIEVLNAYREALPADGHVFFTQTPFPNVALSLSRGEYIGWTSDAEETIARYARPGVEVVSTIEVLEAPLLAGEDLYFTTDHHWKPRAACYVAEEMLKRIGIDPIPYDDYTFLRYSGFYGSTITEHPERKNTTPPDTIDVLIPPVPVKGYAVNWDRTEKEVPFMVTETQTYYAYLGGTFGPWRRFETGVDCGRRCLVIGDSFICCFVPFLTPYYEEVHTTDFREYYYNPRKAAWTVSEYIREHGIDDVYVICSTSTGINYENMLVLLRKFL